MRRDSPVHFDEERQRWDLFRYEEIDRILGDHEAFTSDRGVLADDSARASDEGGSILQTMISVDPPEHERLREFVNERFQPGTLREYRPRIEELTEELLDDIEGDDRFDFVDRFAVPLPVIVIAELLGIPSDRRDQFKDVVGCARRTFHGRHRHRPDQTGASAGTGRDGPVFRGVAGGAPRRRR